MMRKIYLFLVTIAALSIFGACSKEGFVEFSGDITYISFTKDMTKDSTSYSFKTYPGGEIVAEVPLRIRGKWLTEPRAFTISADKDSDLPTTAYELPEACEFSPGQEFDTVRIKFMNNFDDLKNKSYRLFLRVNESENVKQGESAYRKAKFYVSNKLEIPIWWSRNDGSDWNRYNIVEQSYLGKYSEKKYLLFLDRLAEDGASFDGKDMAVLKKYALRLKYWLEAFNNDPDNLASGKAPMQDEDNDETMRVTVAG